MAERKPTVLWAQRPDSIFMTIDLKDVKDQVLDVTETKITFSGVSADVKYAFEFEFFAPIDQENSKINTRRLIELYLPKKEEDSWSNVAKTKQSYVKVDWNKWLDSDDEGEGFDTEGMGGMGGGMPGGMGGMPGMGGMGGMPGMGGMDFSQLMGGMGGMGGMPGMGGDSDDEDGEDELGDLDEPVGEEESVPDKPVVEVETPADTTVGA